ncbi:DinB family protein [Pseudooceanicola sp.]|uniref:DinB family protein n=1 Tax=Pseudooceanicola sp. TaxID=1914328 RepID=UPI0035C6A029
MTMITTEWVRMMARYNRWQNERMERAMAGLSLAALTKDRGAFFGSILATANHLVWGDLMWLSRLDGGAGPGCGMKEGLTLTPTHGAWSAERFRTDGRLTAWAEGLSQVDLAGNLTWIPSSTGQERTRPMGLIVTHVFNHQTHHRGQIHAMLTAAGAQVEDTDLPFMEE